MTPDPKEVEKMAMEFCPDELDHQYHSDKHACVKISKLLAAQEAEFQARLGPWVEAVKKFLRIDVEGDPTYECGEGVAWNKPCSCRWHRAHDAVRAILAKHTGESNG